METKINNKIKDSLKKERDVHYVFTDNFFTEVGGITEKEDELAQKFMAIIGSIKHEKDEIILCIEPNQLHHFFFRLQREIQRANN